MRSHSRSFQAIGTHWEIDTERSLNADEWTEIDALIEEFDRTYSRFRADSLVSKIADGPGRFEFPADVLPLIGFYRELYDATGGAVSPLVGGVLEHLGYGGGRPNAEAHTPAWDDVMHWDGVVLTTSAPLVLDVGAAGKGYLVDLITERLRGFGVGSAVVDGSGDLRHYGPDSIRVGLEHPGDASKVIGVTTLANRSLAASAVNRRRWGAGLHHVIDPHTGAPTSAVIATWAIADSAMVADGLATALFFQPDDRPFETSYGASWVRISRTGTVQRSAHFEGELFT